jgi:hypothetical protein
MRPEDFRDYVALRRVAENLSEIVRFRKRKGRAGTLRVRMRDGHSLELRGGTQDFHVFHRIYLRDEYRLTPFRERDWSCVVDLGANVGLFATRASWIAERVISYEPASRNFEQLRRNVDGWRGIDPLPLRSRDPARAREEPHVPAALSPVPSRLDCPSMPRSGGGAPHCSAPS